MTGTVLVAAILVGGGLALLAMGMLARAYEREEQLSDILDLPYGEKDVDLRAVVEQHSSLVENTIGFAGKMVDQIDAKGSLLGKLEQARLPVRPGEFVIITVASAIGVGGLVGVTLENVVFGVVGAVAVPFLAIALLDRLIARRKRKFEEQFPDALTLIASSLSAGHTILRAIQLMTEEAEPPIAEEFGRVVNETQLGATLVDALDSMAQRLQIRDVDWVVQAIRIQQTVGGKLADLLHTLADFIRAREEIRREIDVLTAEGKVSAYILGALPVFLLFVIQAMNPGYMDPMFQGWGWVFLGAGALSISMGMVWILRMVKVDI